MRIAAMRRDNNEPRRYPARNNSLIECRFIDARAVCVRRHRKEKVPRRIRRAFSPKATRGHARVTHAVTPSSVSRTRGNPSFLAQSPETAMLPGAAREHLNARGTRCDTWQRHLPSVERNESRRRHVSRPSEMTGSGDGRGTDEERERREGRGGGVAVAVAAWLPPGSSACEERGCKVTYITFPVYGPVTLLGIGTRAELSRKCKERKGLRG